MPMPRKRKRGGRFLAAFLARLRSAAGARHATPVPPVTSVPLPREPEPDDRDPMETKLDLHWWVEDRVRPYVDDAAPQPGAHRRPL